LQLSQIFINGKTSFYQEKTGDKQEVYSPYN
jgi:hypothetical protein